MSLFSLNAVGVEFAGSPILSDVTQPTRGGVARSSGLRVAYLEQHRDFGAATTVWEATAGPFAELLALEQSLAEQAAALADAADAARPRLLARYDRDLQRFEHEGGYTFTPRVDAVLHGLGFDPEAARSQPLATLSGGERGRVGLARQLVAPADVLLLDEPTNHLDLDTTLWLESHLRESPATLLVVSHDRAFLEGVVDHVLHLEAGTAVAYRGTYSAFVEQRAERRLAQGRAFVKQRAFLAAEEDFIQRNIAGQKSRQAKGRRKRLGRLPRLSPPPGEEGVMAPCFQGHERGGDQVLVAEDLRLEVDGRLLVERFSGRIGRGERVGFVGPNGAGKSTLLRAVAGERPVNGGELRVGASIRPAHYRQDMAQVPAGRALCDVIHDLRPEWTRGAVQSHLGRFGFAGAEARRESETLSGGERARLALAMLVLSGANFLLLDEPTNHLDVESIEALEDSLREYDGTVLLVSHDRALLRALATRVWVLHQGRITDYPGTFEEWEVTSAERRHAARVEAEEEEALRRVAERRQTRAPQRKTASSSARSAIKAVAAAEARVADLERLAGELEGALQDPALYAAPEGVRRATELGARLESVRSQLEQAIEEWARETEAWERLRGATGGES
jgi:ATP-binding cassette subfamily F protein 3